MNRLLAPVLIAVLAAGCAQTGQSSSSASPPMTPLAAEPSASASPSREPTSSPTEQASAVPTDEPTDEPAPSADAEGLVDTVVATVVEGLSVRLTPGTGGERIGFLALGTEAYVLEGPDAVDGLPWYRVTGLGLPYASGCVPTPSDRPISCPAFHGWVAGANASGDPWLAPTDPGPCPEPTIQSISEWGFTWRLICWSDVLITFDAWWPEIPDDAGLGGACGYDLPGGFLYCQHINYNGLGASPEEGFGSSRLALSIDPESEVSMPKRGQWIRVTGQFDHPAASDCANPDLLDEGDSLDSAVFRCRLQFVPASVEPLGS